MDNIEINSVADSKTDMDILEGDEKNDLSGNPNNASGDGRLDEVDSDKEGTSDENESEDKPESESEGDEKLDDPSSKSIFAKLKEADKDIFKKVPELRKIIANEGQYVSAFSTPEEAKGAKEELDNFHQLAETILSGDPKQFLNELMSSSKESAEKFVSKFLPTLKENSPQAYVQVTTPIVKGFLRNVREYAKNNKNQDLFFAVGHLAAVLQNGNPVIEDDADPDPRMDEIENQKKELTQKQQEFEKKQNDSFYGTTVKEIDSRLKLIVRRDLDPENVVSEKLKNAMVADVLEQIDSVLGKDGHHVSSMNALWREAHKAGLTVEARDKIITAYLARVKPLIPGLRQKIREDYLGADKRKKEQLNNSKKFIPQSGSTGLNNRGKVYDPKKVDYKHTTDNDIFEDRVNLKK